jgi:hypothetical protein
MELKIIILSKISQPQEVKYAEFRNDNNKMGEKGKWIKI